jgi:hypothetical protein
MKTDTDTQIINAIIRYGGKFEIHIGRAAAAADSENLRRIKQAFPEMWEEYRIFLKLP